MIKQILLVALVIFNLSLRGQNETKHQLSIELDPAPYLLGGYSVSLKYSAENNPKIAYMAAIYQSDFPDGMMTETNKDKGWTDMKIETSYAAFLEFYLNEERKGFYFGPSVFWYNKSVELESVNSRTEFSTIYPNFRAGYIWYPFKKLDLYINPWCAIGSEINLDEQNQLNGVEFETNAFNYVVALHIGYTIEW